MGSALRLKKNPPLMLLAGLFMLGSLPALAADSDPERCAQKGTESAEAMPYFEDGSIAACTRIIGEQRNDYPPSWAYGHRGLARLFRGELDDALSDIGHAINLISAEGALYINRRARRERARALTDHYVNRAPKGISIGRSAISTGRSMQNRKTPERSTGEG